MTYRHCLGTATHKLRLEAMWCGGCSRWHFRLQSVQPSEPWSRQWSIIDSEEWDHTLQMEELRWDMLPGLRERVRDLQRLFVELDAGIQRLL